MLHYVCHDLFESPAQTLVNTVNTVGVMGKGIAAEFKRRYPAMFERYQEHCRTGTLTVGQLYLFRTSNKWVLNFPTKQHWRSPSKLEWIEAGLKKFVAEYEARGITSVSFPQLGCGNGGLDWAHVKRLMDQYLRPLPIPVFIHTRINDPKFVPEHQGDRHPTPVDPKTLSETPESISFHEVLQDFMRLFGHEDAIDIEFSGPPEAEEPPPLPAIEIEDGERRLRVTGESLQHVWNKLLMRGALPAMSLPGFCQQDSALLAHHLQRLRYIESIAFVDGSIDAPELHPGIRFAPPPGRPTADLFIAQATEHRAN
ncbi:macro domain-containing protein [Enhygromyxa salina]|uniref:Macro domain protein n=1 Tax=Enhygromyxa salina TaxID=215803 RepID=A0A2S9YUT5_9BACT|nr:macro domain-containing protein [Enhygromyxa salina]PRQ08875.1 Macro domain protein [Enhygromyxa salina]